jgi:hypothetical protein
LKKIKILNFSKINSIWIFNQFKNNQWSNLIRTGKWKWTEIILIFINCLTNPMISIFVFMSARGIDFPYVLLDQNFISLCWAKGVFLFLFWIVYVLLIIKLQK